MAIDYRTDPKLFIGAAFVTTTIDTVDQDRATRKRAVIKFPDGRERFLALTTLRSLAQVASRDKRGWAKQAAKALSDILSAAENQMRNDPVLQETDRSIRREQVRRRVDRLKASIVTQLREAAGALEPEDFDGQVIDLGDLARLAIAERVMES